MGTGVGWRFGDGGSGLLSSIIASRSLTGSALMPDRALIVEVATDCVQPLALGASQKSDADSP
jgi:hypothetical protein